MAGGIFCLAAAGCETPVGGGAAHQTFTNCRLDDGITICTDRAEYHPLDRVIFTVSSQLHTDVFEDRCSGGIEGRPSREHEWSGSYGMARVCRNFTTHEDVVEEMRRLPTSAVVADTFHINARAYDGQWRVWIRVLGADGHPIRERPFTSPAFPVVGSGQTSSVP